MSGSAGEGLANVATPRPLSCATASTDRPPGPRTTAATCPPSADHDGAELATSVMASRGCPLRSGDTKSPPSPTNASESATGDQAGSRGFCAPGPRSLTRSARADPRPTMHRPVACPLGQRQATAPLGDQAGSVPAKHLTHGDRPVVDRGRDGKPEAAIRPGQGGRRRVAGQHVDHPAAVARHRVRPAAPHEPDPATVSRPARRANDSAVLPDRVQIPGGEIQRQDGGSVPRRVRDQQLRSVG